MDIKELKGLLKILRAQGVIEFKTQELELKFQEQPMTSQIEAQSDLLDQEMSEEDRIFYSAIPPTEQLSEQ